MRIAKNWKKCWPILGLVLLAGCGGGGPAVEYNSNVTGTLKLGGVPLANVRVTFTPQLGEWVSAPNSSAITDEAGKFELRCDNQKPGAVIAKHKVVVRQGRAKEDRSARDNPSAVSLAVPTIYTVAAKSPLEVDVTKDQSVYDLNLTPE